MVSNLSIEYARTLLKRAKDYLYSAEKNYVEGLYDVSIVEAEIASQLAIKSLIIKLGFEPPRTHRIRRLLSFIIENKLLDKDLINKLQVFIKTYRRDLIILERAREAGQYGSLSVDKEEAEIILNIAREVVRIAKELWSMAP